MAKAESSDTMTNTQPASSSEIMQAVSPYLTTGPSGLNVRIGTKEITLRREQRKVVLPRDTSIDALVENAVELSGPLTPDEVAQLFEPSQNKGLTMKIEGDTLYLTRRSHIAKVRTGEGKIREIHMKDRTVSSSLDVPMAHVTSIINDLVQGGEIFE